MFIDRKYNEFNTVTISVENMEQFILRTKDGDYVLDFQRLLEDYGVEVKSRNKD